MEQLQHVLSWLWENIQSVDSLVALLMWFGGAVGVWWQFFRKTPPLPPDGVRFIPASELERAYYTHLADQCQRYDLGSFRDSKSVAEQSAIQVRLADVYVDLMAHELRHDDSDTCGAGVASPHGDKQPSKLLLELLADKALTRLVIRGDVGSGKTSFINYLCYSMIESSQGHLTTPAVPEHWLRRPVMRVLLREIGGQICESENLQEELLSLIRQRMLAQVRNRCEVDEACFDVMWKDFRHLFVTTGVLILDGLDEVSGSLEQSDGITRRQTLLRAIRQLARNPQYEGMSIIVTSRNHAYSGDDTLLGFRLLQFDPLNNSDRYADFIRHWYQRVADTNKEKQASQGDANKLLNNIWRRKSLNPLTATPLLLTLVLVLDKAKLGLPESRAELYQSAVSLLLDRWNKQLIVYMESLSRQEQQALDVLQRDVNILLEAMKILAYQTYRDAEGTGIGTDESIVFSVPVVESALKEQLEQREGLGFEHQNSFHHFLRFRSQLLVAAGDGVSFVHKSFHEYLAAAYVMDRSMSRDDALWTMTGQADKRDWWREVFLFALNIEKAEYVLQLMKEPLSRQVSRIEPAEMDNHLGALSLFSDAAVESCLDGVVSREGRRNPKLREAYRRLQEHLECLWEDARLSIRQRAQLGRIHGRCGDVRKGMTLQRSVDYVIRYHTTEISSFPLPDFDWQEISAGRFLMGTEGEGDYVDEKPAHWVSFKQSFQMARSAVTNAQYQAFVDAGGYTDESIWSALPEAAQAWRRGESPSLVLLEAFPEEHRAAYRQALQSDRTRHQPRYWQDNRWNIANHPVVGVSWFEALAYCEWLNRQRTVLLPEVLEGRWRFRLPSEDEWEYAARGGDALPFACGGLSVTAANYDATGFQRTNAAGVFAAGQAFGLDDMTGNVWEWTSSRWGKDVSSVTFPYGDDYLYRKIDQNNLGVLECRITRGGSWYHTTDFVRCAARDRFPPDLRNYFGGFRVMLSF